MGGERGHETRFRTKNACCRKPGAKLEFHAGWSGWTMGGGGGSPRASSSAKKMVGRGFRGF